MALNKKPSALAPRDASAFLDQLSKAALLDLAWDLFAAGEGEESPSIDKLRERVEPVLRARGDRMPKVRVAAKAPDGTVAAAVKEMGHAFRNLGRGESGK